MWRSVRLFIPNTKLSTPLLRPNGKLYSTSGRSNGNSGKVIFGTVASIGLGFTGATVYGLYQHDPKFKQFLDNTLNFNYIFTMLKDDSGKLVVTPKGDLTEGKRKAVETALSDKIEDINAVTFQESKPPIESEPKPSRKKEFSEVKHVDDRIKDGVASYEVKLMETLEKLKQVYEDAINAQKLAARAVRFYSEKLHQAFDPDSLSSGDNGDFVWNKANFAGLEKEKCLRVAKQKAAEAKILTQKLKNDAKNLSDQGSDNPLIKIGEQFAQKCSEELQISETEVAAAQKDSETAFENEHLLKTYEDDLWKELEVILPNYLYEKDINNDDKILAEDDLYLLLSHAYLRIEQLQKEIVERQVTEKLRIDEEIRNQRIEDERKTGSKLQTEMQRRLFNLESVMEDRVALARANFEAELHQQLFRQAAVHADHLQEVLRVKGHELERKHMLELEEKLLRQKNVFMSQSAENMARLKGIVEYLQRKNELEKSSKRAQALWLASEELNYKILFDKSENLKPLAQDIAAFKIAADEDNDFINSVLSSIPPEAADRGVVPYKILKKRFENVKRNCKKVALVDENNDSLYRYFLSYLQSFLIIDNVDALIKSRERENKVAVDASEWDTYDILSRISYCIKVDDLEQALRFANQLKGEPRAVAKDWINEVKLFLETELAIRTLLAYAVAVNVQAYH